VPSRKAQSTGAYSMTDHRLSSYGVLLLRLALGTMFIAHSVIYMLFTLTLSGTSEFFNSIGLPSWLAYATVLVEAVGGILLILGGPDALGGTRPFANPHWCNMGSRWKRLAFRVG
jgi:putative oxidoreductase